MNTKNVSLTICMNLLSATLSISGAAENNQRDYVASYSFSARQGSRRPTMEDASVGIPAFGGDPEKAFFGVYDGHGGSKAAQTVAKGTNTVKPLHTAFAECTEDSVVAKFKYAFKITEEALLKGSDPSGTTAVTAYLDRTTHTLTIANLGDSRAVLLQGETLYATVDHKPTAPDEKKRIQEKGGSIRFPRGPKASGYISSGYNSYAVSRALGDKKDKTGWFKIKGFSAKPEIMQIQLTDEPSFLILACDGIWDVISSADAARTVAVWLNLNDSLILSHAEMPVPVPNEIKEEAGNCPYAISAARALRDAAFQQGSKDNLTALVAIINKSAPFSTTFSDVEKPFPVLAGTVPSDEEADDFDDLGWS